MRRSELNAVLLEAAKFTYEERRARIARCVADGRHDPDTLPFCIAPPGTLFDTAISAGV
jgi:hypothetical protein